jgi:hypothetical protein
LSTRQYARLVCDWVGLRASTPRSSAHTRCVARRRR